MIYVHIIWDFDGAIGQINATYPYRYHEAAIYEELQNVARILEIAKEYDVKFTFAITGFTAEEGIEPYHQQNLIRRIHREGHEIASHTWRHEWLPVIQHQQLIKTLERSRYALEKCIGVEGAVLGLVPPHNRPMSWYRKGAFSLGDRAIFPFYRGAELGSVIHIAGQCGYSWVRVSYRPLFEKLAGIRDPLRRNWEWIGNVLTVPMHYTGFDPAAERMVREGVRRGKDLVLSGHPLMLSRPGKAEGEGHLRHLLDFLTGMKDQVQVMPVNQNPAFQLHRIS